MTSVGRVFRLRPPASGRVSSGSPEVDRPSNEEARWTSSSSPTSRSRASASASRSRSGISVCRTTSSTRGSPSAKATLGERCVILGHHYQRDEVIKFADYIGDSLKLSRAAASRTKADFIVFCGVHFMAESADILRAPHQKVVLPDLAAGCSMADMAAPDQLEICWREMEQMGIRTDAVERTAAPASFRSPTSTRRRPSKPSSAPTAASSAPRPTRRPS